jgi:sulfate permease, SulP family
MNDVFRSRTILPALAGGLVIGFTEIIFAASLASLIFTGPLAEQLPLGIGMMLAAAAVHLLFTAQFATADGIIGSVQDNPAVLMAVAVGAMLPWVATAEQLLTTVIALVFVSILLVGVFLLLMGHFRLGGLVRYIPYPVIGGFMAGTGWLLT